MSYTACVRIGKRSMLIKKKTLMLIVANPHRERRYGHIILIRITSHAERHCAVTLDVTLSILLLLGDFRCDGLGVGAYSHGIFLVTITWRAAYLVIGDVQPM